MCLQQFIKEQKRLRINFFTQSFLSASYFFIWLFQGPSCPTSRGGRAQPHPPQIKIFILFSAQFYLAVDAEHEEHGEEEYCPQRGDGQLCHCLWVSQKCQSRAWGEKQETKHQRGGLGLGFSVCLGVSGCSTWAGISAGRCSLRCKHLVYKMNQPKAKKKNNKITNPKNPNHPLKTNQPEYWMQFRSCSWEPPWHSQGRNVILGLAYIFSSLSPQAVFWAAANLLLCTVQKRNRDSSEMEKALSSISSVPICWSIPSTFSQKKCTF